MWPIEGLCTRRGAKRTGESRPLKSFERGELGQPSDHHCSRYPTEQQQLPPDTVKPMKNLPGFARLHLRVLGVACLLGIAASCGGNSSADYSAFCTLANDMQKASGGQHSEDPAAITDPKKMEEAWTTITDLAIKMRGGSPEKISDDVATMVDSIVAMNKVFKDNKYDLLGMSKKPEVREQLAKISGDEKVAIASNRYNKFMEDNCPPLE